MDKEYAFDKKKGTFSSEKKMSIKRSRKLKTQRNVEVEVTDTEME